MYQKSKGHGNEVLKQVFCRAGGMIVNTVQSDHTRIPNPEPIRDASGV